MHLFAVAKAPLTPARDAVDPMLTRHVIKDALRDLGSLLGAASYGPFGAFGAIVEATGPDAHTRLSPPRPPAGERPPSR